MTVSNTANLDWNEALYLLFDYATNEITIEVIGQDNLGRDRVIFSNATPPRNVVKKAADVFFTINERH